MKRLCLIRSAKAGWDDPTLSDFEREISPKGIKNTKTIGSFLMLKGFCPDLILSSCALRAQQTAQILTETMNYEGPVSYLEALYKGSVDRIREMIAAQDEGIDNVLVITHTPVVRELSQILSHEMIGKFPTSAAALLSQEKGGWEKIAADGTWRLDLFVYPKQFKYFMPLSVRNAG